MNKYRPVGAWILIKEIAPQKEQFGDLTIETNEESKVADAEVIAVGPGVQLSNGQWTQFFCKAGDTVKFRKFAGLPVKLDGEEYFMLYESDVLLVIESGDSSTKFASDIAIK